ncbi:amino acid adenylation domain-containing protein [Streptomyces sp. NPDC001941]|uniref:amino acid adenylation domain-containing protein n=1 Tax=Streptomyces sp. NPDC001941 TaxID=3154659 RepID=UPI00331A5B23
MNAHIGTGDDRLPELDRLAGEVDALLGAIGLARPADRIDTRFAATASRNAARTATWDAEGKVTYLELEWMADEIARRLEGRTGPGRLVALRASRGRYAPGGVLGILRSGAAYLPVDPHYPAARQEFLLSDSGADLVLSDSGLLADEVPIAKAGPFVLATRPTATATVVLPEDAAYVIYTSGSTGLPKGCVVGHSQVLALLDSTIPILDTGPEDVWTLFHSLSFDFSVWELWGPLLYGGQLTVVDREAATDPLEFARLVAERGVTVLNQVPSAFSNLTAEAVAERMRFPALRRVVFGGEALVPDDIRTWWERQLAPNAALVNMYGITETTVHVTFCELTPETLASPHTPVGRPLPHLTLTLRDEDGTEVGPGEPGEVWVGGAGVAYGYLNRPELTAARFVDGEYRSGDWAVADEDGALHYIGRRDGQVKVRGFRIELGEVESVLRTLPGVSAAACAVPAETGALTAYVVGDPETASSREIRASLSAELPPHMVPQVIHHLPRLPLTPHGKLDRASLPV